MNQKVSMLEMAGGRDILAGAPRGKEALAKMIMAVSSAAQPEAVLLNFEGIQVATASFLRESVLGFRNYCTRTERHLYPVVANANDLITEELQYLLNLHSDALVVCDVANNGELQSQRIIGHLNDKERLTVDAVIAAGEVDAAMLASQYDTEQIKITGWNNRLSSLVLKGIVMEVRKGRSKVYRPILT